MALKDYLANDMANVFLNTDDFAQAVMYHYSADGTTATVDAQVFVEQDETVSSASPEHAPRIRIVIARPVGKTITSGSDSVDISIGGETAVNHLVSDVIKEDVASLTLQLA